MPLSIEGISTPIEALIFDMDGVLWKDNTPIGNPAAFFPVLQEHHIQYGFITNNGTKTIASYQQKLARFGIPCEDKFILNSGLGIAYQLKELFPSGGNIYIVGEQGLIDTLAAHGFFHHDEPVENTVAVVVSFDHNINFQKINYAARLIRDQGVFFYCTNTDSTFPTPEGLIPGAGTMVAAVATASGKEPVLVGKPQPYLLTLMLERMQLHPHQVLVIGDRLETDILGGIYAGCPTMLVLSGVSTRAMIDEVDIHPTIVHKDIYDLLGYFSYDN
jgi:4-nitrophenyl phosphatase